MVIFEDTRERGEVDEFGQGARAYVEEGENGCTTCAAAEGADFQEALFFVAGVDAYGFAYYRRAEDDSFVVRGACGHCVDQSDVMLARLIGDVDGSTADAAAGGMEAGVGVRGLEHVPVGQDVEMGGEQTVVCVDEDVPGVRARDARKEVVAVADHLAGLIEGELGVEEDLWELGHAGDGFYIEIAQRGNSPSVLEGRDEAFAVWGVVEEVEDKLRVCFDRIDTTREEEFVEVVVHAVDVGGVDNADFIAGDEACFFSQFDCFVVLRYAAFGRDAAPVAGDGVPNGYVLDIWVLFSDSETGVFEAVGEAFFIRFEIGPAALKLIFAVCVK